MRRENGDCIGVAGGESLDDRTRIVGATIIDKDDFGSEIVRREEFLQLPSFM